MRKAQVGKETTAGTLVPATRLIAANWKINEDISRYYPNYPRGYRSNMGGAAGVITKRHSMAEFTTDLNAEEIMWPLSTGVLGTPTPTGTPPLYSRVYAPQLTTGILTMDTATYEFVDTDGTTNHYYGEFGHALTDKFSISYKEDSVPELKWSVFGRARQTGTPTAALTEYSTREALPSQLLTLYVDTTWAGLGTTQQTCIVKTCDLDVTTGLQPVWNASGRTDLDMCSYSPGMFAMSMKLTLELNATAATMLTAFRASSAQFIRMKYTGSAIGAGVKTVQVDGAFRFVPGSKADIAPGPNGNMLVSFDFENYVDTTSGKTAEFTVINGLATIA